jgi:uncharacterized protein involved in exopolysaccharide biosynthesis
MELIDILRVMRRWAWLIVAIVVVTELALWLGVKTTSPSYAARVGLQISTPQREEVAAYDEYRSTSLRDEITTATNNFADLLQSREVVRRTVQQLGLGGRDAHYTVDVQRARDADFITVVVEARTPGLAADIANKHVQIAIAYYGELRAQPTRAEKELFAGQLRTAEEEFRTAEASFAAFQAEHGITSMDHEQDTYRQLLSQLELERDQRRLDEMTTTEDPVAEVDKLIAQRQKEMERLLALAPNYQLLSEKVERARDRYRLLFEGQFETKSAADISAAQAGLPAAEEALLAAEKALADYRTENGIFALDNQIATQQKLLEQLQLERDQRLLQKTTSVSDPVAEVDKLIAQRKSELDALATLAPQYNILSQQVDQARAAYEHLLSKYGEAQVKVNAVEAANFIQVVNPAFPPAEADSNWGQLAMLAFAGSLGLGVVVAFLLQYVRPIPAAGQQLAPPRGHKSGLRP